MTDRNLLSFVELARAPQLRQLATRLHVTPATLSLRIKSLEDSLGVSLFDNEGQKLVLTAAGKRLLPIAESILKGYSDLRAVAKHMARDPEHTVRLGVIESVIHTFLPTLLAAFARELPDIKIELSLDRTRNLLPELLAGDLDIVLCVGDSPFEDRLVVDDLLMFPVHWVANRQSGLVGSDLAHVLSQRLFTQMVNTAPYQAVVTMLNGLDIVNQPDAAVEAPSVIGSPSLAALVAMTRQNLGVSIMPGIFVQEFLETGELVCLPMPQPRPSMLSQCHQCNPTSATLAAAQQVRQVCDGFLRQHATDGLVLSPTIMRN